MSPTQLAYRVPLVDTGNLRISSRPSRTCAPTDKKEIRTYKMREATSSAYFPGTDRCKAGLSHTCTPAVTRVHVSGLSSTYARADKRKTTATLEALFSITDRASGLSCACTTTITRIHASVSSHTCAQRPTSGRPAPARGRSRPHRCHSPERTIT